jgi:hypothetical protein
MADCLREFFNIMHCESFKSYISVFIFTHWKCCTHCLILSYAVLCDPTVYSIICMDVYHVSTITVIKQLSVNVA